MTGRAGAHLVAWSQTRIDQRRPGPVADLRPGVRWEWHGRAIPLHHVAIDDDRVLWRAILRHLPAARLRDGLVGEMPFLDRALTLIHNSSIYDAVLVELVDLARPMILFRDGLPPEGVALLVAAPASHPHELPEGITSAREAPFTPARIRV
jgi:hypothetical protein